jgi:hypothetical protein
LCTVICLSTTLVVSCIPLFIILSYALSPFFLLVRFYSTVSVFYLRLQIRTQKLAIKANKKGKGTFMPQKQK